jgi:hypothetical protein
MAQSAYTCSNNRYETNSSKGYPHGPGQALGSVFEEPLYDKEGYSLWLEYVTEKKTGEPSFWLMWYDGNGHPTIQYSAIFDGDQIRKMVAEFAKFIQV